MGGHSDWHDEEENRQYTEETQAQKQILQVLRERIHVHLDYLKEFQKHFVLVSADKAKK